MQQFTATTIFDAPIFGATGTDLSPRGQMRPIMRRADAAKYLFIKGEWPRRITCPSTPRTDDPVPHLSHVIDSESKLIAMAIFIKC